MKFQAETVISSKAQKHKHFEGELLQQVLSANTV